MLRKTITLTTAFGLALAGVLTNPTAVAREIKHAEENAPEFKLKGDSLSIPFVMVREFPFVKAEVNGVKGKLLLDTGALGTLSLNHNHLNLPAGRVVGQGNFASGQMFQVILRPSVESVRLVGGPSYRHVTNVNSQDASQLERITPDFLGWLGYGFWAGYAAKFDYKASKVTFYKGEPEAFLKGETVVAAIPFETRNRPNVPVLTARVGDTDFETVLDTGQYGNIFADAATFKHLSAIGAISPAANAEDAVDIKAVRFSKGPAIPLTKIASHPVAGAAPFAKAVGLTSPKVMMLGYAFLRQYKTVWDYPNKTLYLLKP